MARGSPRLGRRAPLGLETLEPRLLMAGDVPSLTPVQLPLVTAEVVTSQPDAPVTLHLPGGDATLAAVAWAPGDSDRIGVLQPGSGIDLYRVTVGPATGSLRIDLTWDALPQGDTGRMLVFDGGGNLLNDSSQDAASNSTTVILGGPNSTPGSVFYVAILIPGPAGSSTAAGEIAYHLQIGVYNPSLVDVTSAPTAGADPSAPVDSTSDVFGLPNAAGIGTVVFAQSLEVVAVPGSSVSTLSAGAQRGVYGPGPSPSPAKNTGAAGTTPTDFDGGDGQGSPSPRTPIDVCALPASPHEAAGGIFSDVSPDVRVDRVAGTRVELSLVRLLSPGWEGSRGDEWPSDSDPGTPSSPRLDSGMASSRDNGRHAEPTSTDDGPRPFRPGGGAFLAGASGPTWSDVGMAVRRSFGLPDAVATAGAVGAVPWALASAATLPPIDGDDRLGVAEPPLPGVEAEDDEEPPEWGNGRGEAILLGLGGSAALGVGLYAPDLASAVRRTVPRPAPNSRPRPASSRGDRAPG